MYDPLRLSLFLGSLFTLVSCSGGDGTEDVFGSGAATASGGNSVQGSGGATTSGGGTTGGGGTENGSGGQVGDGGTSTGGGANGSGGASGGVSGDGGSNGGTTNTGGSTTDQNGKSNAMPGETTDAVQDYLKLGEIRILNNNWGSEDLGCTAPNSTMSVFVDESKNFGWNFSRGDCAPEMDSSHPDFPQVEFGIHPFGVGSHLQTSPPFSSTPLLPIQIKDVTSAKVVLDNLNMNLSQGSSWNLTMEFWLSEGDPRNQAGNGVQVHTEVMAWWGWNNGRWPCDSSPDKVNASGKDYTLCHQADQWAEGWRYFQFRAGDGSDGNISTNFTGEIDVKSFLDYLNQRDGGTYHGDLWLTRMEVGSEIDDNTAGTVSMSNIIFELNGQSRGPVFTE